MDMRIIQKAGLLMSAAFRHLSYLIVASSAFGYKSDESHFIMGIVAFAVLQVTALLLSVVWAGLKIPGDEGK